MHLRKPLAGNGRRDFLRAFGAGALGLTVFSAATAAPAGRVRQTKVGPIARNARYRGRTGKAAFLALILFHAFLYLNVKPQLREGTSKEFWARLMGRGNLQRSARSRHVALIGPVRPLFGCPAYQTSNVP